MKINNCLLLRHILRSISIIAASTCCLHGATFTVTTTNISGPGSLPVAIVQANTTPGKNKILFTVTNVTTLGLQLPAITNSVSIMGRTDVPTVISGGGVLPLFAFAAGTTNSLSNLVLANGSTTGSGAAISNASTLSVNNCTITNHTATSGSGGAIINNGSMTILSSTISYSAAASGGAIFNAANMTVAYSQLFTNQAYNGAAIFNTGSLVLNSVSISNNRVTLGFGGGVWNSGSLSIIGSTLNGNLAIGGSGGSGYDVGGGGGAGLGGAIFSTNGSVSINNSTFANNAALGGAGGNANLSGGSTNTTANGGGNNPGNYLKLGSPNGGFGGGGGGGQISYSPYYGGYGGFGGGGGGIGPIVGVNGGFGGGTANGVSILGNGGGGGAGIGAGIFVVAGTLDLVNCTVAFNQATGGTGGQVAPGGQAGNGGQGIGGGIFNIGGTITLLNTIIASNGAQNSSPDLYGNFTTTGYNLIGNIQGATNLSIFDFQNVVANLGPFQDNGGATLTCAPLHGSLAIGNGTSAGAPTIDQRGVPRPQGGAFDIGAVQAVTGSPFVSGGTMVSGSGFKLNTIFDATNSYRVQASTNLTTWVNLSTNGSGGALHFIDTAATNLNRRFYRTATP